MLEVEVQDALSSSHPIHYDGSNENTSDTTDSADTSDTLTGSTQDEKDDADSLHFNENKPWTHDDLEEIYRLYQYGLTIKRIARFLGRSSKSVDTALRRIMVQQALHTSLKEVDDHYSVTRVPDLLNSKYYVPMKPELSYVFPQPRSAPWWIFVYLICVISLTAYGVVMDPIE